MSRPLVPTIALLVGAALSGCSFGVPQRAASPPPVQPLLERLAFDDELGPGGWEPVTDASPRPWAGWSAESDSVCDGEFDILLDGAPDALREAEATYRRDETRLSLRVVAPIDSWTMGRINRALSRCHEHTSQRVRNGSVETVTFTALHSPPPGGTGAVITVSGEDGAVETRRIVFANDGVVISSAIPPGEERTTLLVITTIGENLDASALESSLIHRFRETDDR